MPSHKQGNKLVPQAPYKFEELKYEIKQYSVLS